MLHAAAVHASERDGDLPDLRWSGGGAGDADEGATVTWRAPYDEALFLHAEPDRVVRAWQRAMSPKDLRRVLRVVELIPPPPWEGETHEG